MAERSSQPWSEDEIEVMRRYVAEKGPMHDGGLLSRALATLDAERARTAVLETALRTLMDSVERPAAPDSEWLEQAVIEARAALATPAEGAGE